ncbi:formate/nitrate transporter [Acinetobacter baumannii]|nr:formate/nitrate transporter [Acinetobacter baumannii]SSU71335.1 formate/nitrate transporter [Acinetobacter baumannii]SSV45198.1 formate/nitrate transporter [Acinetobacter baumannii]
MDHELEEEKVDQTLSWREKMAVEEHEKLSPRLVYEIIRRDGAEELDRRDCSKFCVST